MVNLKHVSWIYIGKNVSKAYAYACHCNGKSFGVM